MQTDAGLATAMRISITRLARRLRVERLGLGGTEAVLSDIQLAALAALERHDGEPWHLHFHSADETSMVKGWQAGCATGLAIVLGGELYDRLGVCTAPHCDRVYVDTTRNGSRRFCSTACQNRVKAAAFRERRA